MPARWGLQQTTLAPDSDKTRAVVTNYQNLTRPVLLRQGEPGTSQYIWYQGLIQWGGGQRGHAPPQLWQSALDFGPNAPWIWAKVPSFASKCPTNQGKMPHIRYQSALVLLQNGPEITIWRANFQNFLGEHRQTPQLHAIFSKSSLQIQTAHVGARREIALWSRWPPQLRFSGSAPESSCKYCRLFCSNQPLSVLITAKLCMWSFYVNVTHFQDTHAMRYTEIKDCGWL